MKAIDKPETGEVWLINVKIIWSPDIMPYVRLTPVQALKLAHQLLGSVVKLTKKNEKNK